MRTIRFLLQKEFRQIFRNKIILAMIIVMPSIQLMILPLAADYEIKNINIAIIDHDASVYSRKLISTVTASGYFQLTGYDQGFRHSLTLIENDQADLILEIPPGFEKNLIREGQQDLFIAVNAINGVKANLGGSYLTRIIKAYNSDIRLALLPATTLAQSPTVDITTSNWFNNLLNYRVFMVPGILAFLVTLVGGFLSCLNIVKEKEVGTIEQINVSPIKKHHFILGKLIPFWILGIVVFTIGLLISWLIYGIIPVGSLLVMYGFVGVYLLSILGFGLLISTISETQQQAMFIMFFFMMVFILLGGLFTSIDSMPDWAQIISKLNPVTYLISVMRMVILKGSGLTDILGHLGITFVFAVVLNTWAIMSYKKTS